jgi:hypothetical protein
MTAPRTLLDLGGLEREAAALLADALAVLSMPRHPDRRGRHRRGIERAIELSSDVLASALADPETLSRARATLLGAHSARARDARHGAGQLSLAAQRAPTRDDCDEGWRRVEQLVAVAEASCAEVQRMAAEIDEPSAANVARAAESAARAARRLIVERNHSYTFHADPGFSFGEGWYLAAAAVLAGVTIQIEPAKAQTRQAERFLRDAGLGSLLAAYRSRPRANKQLPEIVARAFRLDPSGAQQRLRRAFLGDGPVAAPIVDWADRELARASTAGKVLIWLRYGQHHPMRNTSYAELVELVERALAVGCVPILVGDALRDGELPAGAVDMTLFWKKPIFQGEDMRRAQLQLFEHLKQRHALVGQLGVTTAGMDGPALMGLPTLYLTDAPNVRLGLWVGAIPDYEEVVRTRGYLDRVSDGLRRWAARNR